MSITHSIDRLIGATAAVVFIGGCGSTLPANQQTTSAVQTSQIKTWISPDAKDAPRLFFQGDVNLGNVYILSFPELKLKGTITGLSEPLGMCSDAKGHVYVVEGYKSRVDEFTRTGTLIATYTDAYGYPSACAVNPQNGNLAVTDNSSLPLKVLVFSSPSSTPTVLTVPYLTYLTYAGYNNKGKLWVDGARYLDFALARCDAATCKKVQVQGAQYFEAGTVQWDNVRKTWVIFDESCGNINPGSCSYPVSEHGVLGQQTSYGNYEGYAVCSLKQAVIGAQRKIFVVGGDWGEPCFGSGSNAVYRWDYPAGGNPTNYYILPNGARPYGAALSIK